MTIYYRSYIAVRWAWLTLAIVPAIAAAAAEDGSKYSCYFTQKKGGKALEFSGRYILSGNTLRSVGPDDGVITITLDTERAFSSAHKTTVRVSHDRGVDGRTTTSVSFVMAARELSSCNAMDGNIPKCLATPPQGDVTFQFTSRDGQKIVRTANMSRPRPFSGDASYSASIELTEAERHLAEGPVRVRVLVGNREILAASGDADSAALSGFLTQAAARFGQPGYLSSGDQDGYCRLRRY
jgi:hypothetical protein